MRLLSVRYDLVIEQRENLTVGAFQYLLKLIQNQHCKGMKANYFPFIFLLYKFFLVKFGVPVSQGLDLCFIFCLFPSPVLVFCLWLFCSVYFNGKVVLYTVRIYVSSFRSLKSVSEILEFSSMSMVTLWNLRNSG